MIARLIAAACLAAWMSTSAAAEDLRLVLDPEATEIGFRLGATLHTVEGSGRLERGAVTFDPATGAAAGEIVIDARSLDTGNAKRDRLMHARVLESETYPRIVFVPERFEGRLEQAELARVRLHGELQIHGVAHPSVISAEVRADGDGLTGTGRFAVPYVALGMRDPSKLLLRVAKEVEVEIRLQGRLGGGGSAAGAQPDSG